MARAAAFRRRAHHASSSRPLGLGDQRPTLRPADVERLVSELANPTNPDGSLCWAAVGVVTERDPIEGTTASFWQVYWGRDGGRRREFVGPRFESLHDAHLLCSALRERADLA